MNTAIIVAAGSGTRFDSATPKQFLDLAGKPVLLHSLQAFQSSSLIDEIVVVVSREHTEKLNEILAHHCGKTAEQVSRDTDRDNFLGAEQARAYGLVDEVVKSRKDVPGLVLADNK